MEKKTQFLAVHFAWQATVITNECRAGVVLRTLVSHQCSPWVQVPYPASYVGLGLGFACSLLCTEEFSLGTPVFPLPQNPTFDLN